MRLPEGYQPQALPPPESAKPRYANSLLTPQQRQDFLQRLTHSMEQEQLFRNGELKLEELAAHLAMTGHELSQLINEECGANFLTASRAAGTLRRSSTITGEQNMKTIDLALLSAA